MKLLSLIAERSANRVYDLLTFSGSERESYPQPAGGLARSIREEEHRTAG